MRVVFMFGPLIVFRTDDARAKVARQVWWFNALALSNLFARSLLIFPPWIQCLMHAEAPVRSG